MANNTTNSDKYFFRNETLPSNTDLPRDVTWAVIEDPGTPPQETSSSYVGDIIFNEKTGQEEWQPGQSPTVPGRVKAPTPIITGVVNQKVVQNSEGVARTNVTLAVNCIDGVEYEVVVTAA